jgi:hypothetical protein
MNLKLLTAAAVIATSIAAPTMAQTVYQRDYDRSDRYDRGPGPVGAAAGVAGAAVGTAAAIATSPFRNSYNYDRDMGPNGYACHPGDRIKGSDGRWHICQ